MEPLTKGQRLALLSWNVGGSSVGVLTRAERADLENRRLTAPLGYGTHITMGRLTSAGKTVIDLLREMHSEKPRRRGTSRHASDARTIAKLREENTKLREVLKRYEFSAECDGENGCSGEACHCIDCGGYECHYEWCELNKLLNGGE